MLIRTLTERTGDRQPGYRRLEPLGGYRYLGLYRMPGVRSKVFRGVHKDLGIIKL